LGSGGRIVGWIGNEGVNVERSERNGSGGGAGGGELRKNLMDWRGGGREASGSGGVQDEQGYKPKSAVGLP